MTRLRRGAMLLEVMVAVALLAMTVTASVRALAAVGRQQTVLDRRACATEAANNLLERLSGHDWAAITPAMAAQLQLPESVAQRLPASQLDIQIAPHTSPEAKQITVTVRWQGATTESARPVRLTTWVYRVGGPLP